MNTTLLHHAKSATDAVSMGDVVALLGTATELRRAALAGSPQRPLRGKNIALLAPSESLPAVIAMADAARALGATVVHVHPQSLPVGDAAAFNETVGLIGLPNPQRDVLAELANVRPSALAAALGLAAAVVPQRDHGLWQLRAGEDRPGDTTARGQARPVTGRHRRYRPASSETPWRGAGGA